MECPSCRVEVREGSKFCSECGAKLSRASEPALGPPVSTPSTTSRPLPSAERRQLTVMFVDLVGSTALSSRLDPEDLREVFGAYHTCVAEEVGRFKGFVAKYMGDGVLVYFGYPQAHEDDAERAVRAGLELVDAVGRLPVLERLQVRIGIGTGLVVVGDLLGSGEAQERGVVGETPNLAARLQALAEPNSIVIGPRTHRLLGGLFEYRDLGTIEVKGFAEPVQAYQVLRPSAVESRFEALRGISAPLIGREEESAWLLRLWERAKSGDGQVALISGEPGIGKSRIAAAIQERIESEPHVRLRYFCSPYHTDSALHPTICQLERAAGFEREDAPETKLSKLETLLAPTAALRDDVALLAELLSIPTGSRYPPLSFTPQRKKEEIFETLLRQLDALARQRSVLIVYEDVHWIDATSRELLDLTVNRVRCLPALLLITFRPEFPVPWTDQPHVTNVALNRLDQREGVALIESIIGPKAALPAAIVDEIVKRTDGIPLFVEELTKAVLEASAGEKNAQGAPSTTLSAPLAVPATLQASLLARLDRLGSAAKEVAQISAAIGREFSYELLALLVSDPEGALRSALNQLVKAELIVRSDSPAEAVYTFRHALLQDAAYRTLLRSKRQALHARVVEALEERFAETVETQPEILAHHCTQARLITKAVDYLRRAGELAAKRSATAGAIAQFRKGLDLLHGLPDNSQRRSQELELCVALGGALMAAKGFAAKETGEAWEQARELCRQLSETSQLPRVLYGQYVFHLVRAELAAAFDVGTELLELGRQRRDTDLPVMGHRAVGNASFELGQLVPAREHLDRALALYDRAWDNALAYLYGFDPRVAVLSYLAWTLFALGYPDQALARSREAVTIARETSHLASLAFAQFFHCALGQLSRRDEAEVRTEAETLVRLASEQGFQYWLAGGTVLGGWALARSGEPEAGLAQLHRGLADWRATGAEHFLPYFLALATDAYGQVGRLTKGLDLLQEAMSRVKRSGERWYEAELYRFKAKLLMTGSDQHETETCLRRALTVARAQDARTWELRAAIDLARLWRAQRKRAEARNLLTPIYDWFSEGFDTPDLKDAKALLKELRE